jgi:N utilization substance protein A
MQTMRYINVLDQATRVKTSKCFVHNNTVFFAVPKAMISKAVGPGAKHVKSVQQKLGRKVKIIQESTGSGDVARFVSSIVAPVEFTSAEIKEGALVIKAGSMQNKAGLLGRHKKRLDELKAIVEGVFRVDLKVI